MKLAVYRYKIYLIKTGIVVLPIILLIVLFKVLTGANILYSRYKFGSDRQEYESSHFHIFTKQIPLPAEQIGTMVENFYTAFHATHGKEFGFTGLERKVEIFLFGNREEFDQFYKKEFLQELPHNAAYYNPGDGKIVLFWTSDHTEKTLYHELTHMILDQALSAYEPDWSIWFNEGLATYFEQARVENGKIVPGPLNQKMLQEIRGAWQAKKFVPLAGLVFAGRERFRSPNNHIYYYESYLLVYFLLHAGQGQYREQFYRYFKEEYKLGPSSPLWNSLNRDANEVEAEFRSYFSIE